MALHSPWRSVATSLPRSKRWRQLSDPAARLWLGLLLTSDLYGCTDADPDLLTLTAVPGLGWTEEDVAACLGELHDTGIVQVFEARGSTWVQIVDFDENQPAAALRKRGARHTPEPPGEGGTRAGVRGPLEDRRKKEEKRIGLKPLSVTPPAKPDPVDSADVLTVYTGWADLQAATGGLVPRKLTDDRRRKIAARLNDGYTPDQLLASIAGFLADPWHLGKNDRGTRYTDLTTILKNAAKVDAGLQLAAAGTKKRDDDDENRSRYVRPAS
jgi:hypothetical protein